MRPDRPIGVAGAGSIGCFVGGLWAAAGRSVALLARPRIIGEIEAEGLRLTSFEGLEKRIRADKLVLSPEPEVFRDAWVVLVTVKSADTPAMAALIDRHAPRDAVIVSLQNGIGNAAALRACLPGRPVLAGMVPFNVVAKGDGHFHRGTSGDIVIEEDPTKIAQRLSVPGLTVRPSAEMEAVQWGKLLVNLNNALNALSDLPLRDQLAQRAWRTLFADQIAEGLAVVKAEGIRPLSPTPVPLALTTRLLRLPDPIFGAVLRRTMRIDPEARSSMWEDLSRGRRTEIAHLQGVITELAARRGIPAPLSRRIVRLIEEAETAGKGSPALSPADIRG